MPINLPVNYLSNLFFQRLSPQIIPAKFVDIDNSFLLYRRLFLLINLHLECSECLAVFSVNYFVCECAVCEW